MPESKARASVTLGTCQGCGALWVVGSTGTIMPHHQPDGCHLPGDTCPGSSEPPMEEDTKVAFHAIETLRAYGKEQRRLGALYAAGIGVLHFRFEPGPGGEMTRVAVDPIHLTEDQRKAQHAHCAHEARSAAYAVSLYARELLKRTGAAGEPLVQMFVPAEGDQVRLLKPDPAVDAGTIGVVGHADLASPPGTWEIAVQWSNGRYSVIRFPQQMISIL